MSELDLYLKHLIDRVDADQVHEEPDFEHKSTYPAGDETSVLWEMADLIAALSNDLVEGYRTVVYGPVLDLERPSWLTDPAVLQDKLDRHFEGRIAPRIELFRRAVGRRGDVDLLAVVERSQMPYVTRHEPHGFWIVRVRAGTRRRTATRAELLSLCRGRPAGAPVRKLEVRVTPHGRHTRKLIVTNVGTVVVRDVRMVMPQVQWCSFVGVGEDGLLGDELLPTESITKLMSTHSGGGEDSFRLEVRGESEDGEEVLAFQRVTVYG